MLRMRTMTSTCMNCAIRLALSGESYFVPSFAEVHARYHFKREVLASCCPSQVACRKPSCTEVFSGTWKAAYCDGDVC